MEESTRNTQFTSACDIKGDPNLVLFRLVLVRNRELSLTVVLGKGGKKTSGSQTKQQETTSFLTVIAYIFFSDFLTLTAHANVAKYPFYSLKKRI